MNFVRAACAARSLACGLVLSLGGVGRAETDGTTRWAFTTLSTATEGGILSSPAAGPDGTIYIGVEVGAASSAAPSGRIFALDENGTQKWMFTAPDWIDSTPAVGSDGTLYFGCWNGVLYALRPDGTTRWEHEAGPFITSSPALAPDGVIYVGAGSDLVAINPDGTLKWFYPAGDWIDSSPAVGPDGTIVFASWDREIYALAPDGSERWRFPTAGTITGSPVIAADGTVYVGSRDAYLYALTQEGILKWSRDTRDTIESSPALGADGTIYLASVGGRLLALNPDGTERWQYPPAGQAALGGLYSSPAARADGSIVFSSSDNAVYALQADGSLRWRAPLGDWSDSSPLVADNGILYVGCADKKIYSLAGTAGPLATDWPQFRRNSRRSGWQPFGATTGTSGRLVNLSARNFAGTGDSTLIAGFVVAGTGARSLLLRGVGPALVNFGVRTALPNPWLSVFSASQLIATNDAWDQGSAVDLIASTSLAVGAFALAPGSLDAAVLLDFSTGGYTVHVSDRSDMTGVALLEVYDASGSAGARLVNLSVRGTVGPGEGVLIGGLVVTGSRRALLLRGVGPALAAFGVADTLAHPWLRVFQGAELIAESRYGSSPIAEAAVAAAAQRAGAFALPSGNQEAALLLTLPPGLFTAQVSGSEGATGTALLEIYELP